MAYKTVMKYPNVSSKPVFRKKGRMEDEEVLGLFADGIKGIFFAVLALFAIVLLYKSIRNSLLKEKLCKTCGAIEKPARVVPGSLILEIILWICFLLPGMLYTGYRISKKYWACLNCGSREIIPLDSPLAAQFIKENRVKSEVSENKAPSLSNWPPKVNQE
jgi:hypothetical protein